MERLRLDRDAHRLLVSIGGTVEQWILDRAQAAASGRTIAARPHTISVHDIRDSIQALLDDGAVELKGSVERVAHQAGESRRAG